VGMIADGVHAHEGALRLAYKLEGPEGLALVTDAMEAAGMAEGEYSRRVVVNTLRHTHPAARREPGTTQGTQPGLSSRSQQSDGNVVIHVYAGDRRRRA
jgi:N-acetylglucosamine-6-phosphate deacetylase